MIHAPVTTKGTVEVAVHRDGVLVHHEVVENLVTNAGDQIYAENAAGITGADAVATGMLLGTGGATAAAKSGGGAAIVTYIAGSAKALDAEPDVTSGVITYVCSWEAGDVVDTGINEVALVNTAGPANSAAAAADTIARAVLTSFDLTALDTATVTWTHTILGTA